MTTTEQDPCTFGDQTLDILDHDPDKLLTVRGIGPGRLKRIRDSYLANRAARDVVAFLAPHGITANRAVKLFEISGRQTLNIVQNHSYRLCEVVGISFHTADKIAMSMGLPRASAERAAQGGGKLTDAFLKAHNALKPAREQIKASTLDAKAEMWENISLENQEPQNPEPAQIVP